MSDNIIISNVVKKESLRKIQGEILNDVAQYLVRSFGPFGSTTIIREGDNASTNYTKDGHDILRRIKYNGVIESTIVDDLVEITRHVVKTVGDGTTSAIQMANEIFKGICSLEEKGYTSREIVDAVERAVTNICDIIRSKGRSCTMNDIYDICYTSTNGNKKLADNIHSLYEQFGENIYIDLQVSTNSVDDVIKSYEGMTVAAGYTDAMFVNSENNTCELIQPKIYIFEDPVDNAEMLALFDKIIHTNIYKAYEQGSVSEPVPTVIIAPKISNDMSQYFNNIANFIMRFNGGAKPPLVVISSYYNADEMSDIAIMCGVPCIKKYIVEEMHQKDIESGRAPTVDNVVDFCGSCGKIVVDSDTSKFIDPAKRYNEDGTDSETYLGLKRWLTNELEKYEKSDGDIKTIYSLKKRLNSLDANLVEYFVGGVSVADRDNDRALLEDAIKNCRSAVANGVGYGANVMGFIAANEYFGTLCEENDSVDELDKIVARNIEKAYSDVIETLYRSANTGLDIKDTMMRTLGVGPLNLRTLQHDGKVLSSIMSDIEILRAVSKIVVLMAISNQFILPNPQYNIY